MDIPPSQENGGFGADRGGTNGRSEGPSVLVAERNQSTRQLMWRALRPTYEPQLAATYEDVRRHVQEQSFDAVVMSLYPFDVDEGIQVVEDVRAKAAHAECPIIAVCHPSVEAESESLRQAGFDDVVRMPFGQSELLAVLDRHLGAA